MFIRRFNLFLTPNLVDNKWTWAFCHLSSYYRRRRSKHTVPSLRAREQPAHLTWSTKSKRFLIPESSDWIEFHTKIEPEPRRASKNIGNAWEPFRGSISKRSNDLYKVVVSARISSRSFSSKIPPEKSSSVILLTSILLEISKRSFFKTFLCDSSMIHLTRVTFHWL